MAVCAGKNVLAKQFTMVKKQATNKKKLTKSKADLVTVAIGPPQNRLDDALMSSMLLQSKGQKIICGGTTSQIVARKVGQPVEIDLSSLQSNLPPYGFLEGVDLVTEGFTTLSHTLNLLKAYIYKNTLPEEYDAAVRLFSILIQSKTIQFIVGSALKTTKNETEISKEMKSEKMRIIENICTLLKSTGKEVKMICL